MTPSLEQCFCPGRFTLLLGGEVGRLVRERFGFRRFKRKMPPSLEQCFCPGRFTLPSEDCFCMFLSSSCRRFFNLKGRSASQGTAHGLQQRWTKPLCWPRCWEKKTLDGCASRPRVSGEHRAPSCSIGYGTDPLFHKVWNRYGTGV